MSVPSIGPDHGQAKSRDPLTAQEAADKVKPGGTRHALLTAHDRNHDGLTDEEAAVEAGISLQSEYATRCSELRRYGLLHDTAMARVGQSGMSRVVRRITPFGTEVLADTDPGDNRPRWTCGACSSTLVAVPEQTLLGGMGKGICPHCYTRSVWSPK